ncbi:unannotated protein [freshwater metagenome]|uniref:Unannotated protein n=1 Tax=freshwater metagenome TaxID=449393 RepID=A0A6J6ZG97_9ZZZZ
MRAASAPTSWSSLLEDNCLTFMTFSGHTTRSAVPEYVRLTSSARSRANRGGVVAARVPCGPPPCMMTIDAVRPVAEPSGATEPIAMTAGISASGPSRRPSRVGVGHERVTSGRSALRRFVPISAVTKVSSTGPPIRAMPTNGPPA